ncbi:hypothetical protein PGT21_031793 [Puccinia graminis f. sp. tritici]|uniref:Uncharacterized protein n=1 Tax=Puccinia graminis f. sp. tritici TaxID=56615 RepID=A0A5B0M7H0_PUCGR|nr:hypothetical protein PGT21_031793 [Puccinia graminis f. sp. tritici]KAA1086321.1 hypothetical protein PGTUg99_011322 [Puccinia graminis f. sp. tritici]
MRFPYGSSGCVHRHPICLIFWSLTVISATNLNDLELNRLDQRAFDRPGPAGRQVFASSPEHPIYTWASMPYESNVVSEESHSLLSAPLTDRNVDKRPFAPPSAQEPSLIAFEPLADEQAGSRKRVKHSQEQQVSTRRTPIYYDFMPGASHAHEDSDQAEQPSTPRTPIYYELMPGSSHAQEGSYHTGPSHSSLEGQVNQVDIQTPIQRLPHDLNDPMAGHLSQVAQAAEGPSGSIQSMSPEIRILESVEANPIPAPKPALPQSNSIGLNGKILVPILSEYYQTFSQKLEEIWNEFNGWKVPWQNEHRKQPIGFFNRPNTKDSRIIRILEYPHRNTQKATVIRSLYKNLLSRIHELHLAGSSVPSEHFFHVRNIFDRLEKEILNPETGVPLTGISEATAKGWKKHFSQTEFGEIQEMLIGYFSGKQKGIQSDLAAELIKSYYTDFENDRRALISHHEKLSKVLDASKEIPMEPYFGDRFKFIFNLPDGHRRFKEFLDYGGRLSIPGHSTLDVLQTAFSEFLQEFRQTQDTLHRATERTDHAGLEICLLTYTKLDNMRTMRVLDPAKKHPYSIEGFKPIYNHLIRAVEFLHVAILNQSQLSKEEHEQRRLALLSWVGDQIMKPKDTYPIFGRIQGSLNSPNLKAKMQSGEKLFPPIQLSLIKYFSGSRTTSYPLARYTAAFILAKWYEFHHPKEFENFFFDRFNPCETLAQAEVLKKRYKNPLYYEES